MLVIRIQTTDSYNIIQLTCLLLVALVFGFYYQRYTDFTTEWDLDFCQENWAYQRPNLNTCSHFQQKCVNCWKCLLCINIIKNRSLGLGIPTGETVIVWRLDMFVPIGLLPLQPAAISLALSIPTSIPPIYALFTYLSVCLTTLFVITELHQ
jgi:hypothetical protein